jgi:hypothetical protein
MKTALNPIKNPFCRRTKDRLADRPYAMDLSFSFSMPFARCVPERVSVRYCTAVRYLLISWRLTDQSTFSVDFSVLLDEHGMIPES